VLHVPCGNRRETACAPCSTVYKRDARQLVRAGLLRLGHHQWTQRRLLSDQLTMASADGQDQGNADGDTRCGTEKAGRTRRRPTWPVRRPPSDQGAAPDLDDAPALARQAGLDN
jgi:hypothetical protein